VISTKRAQNQIKKPTTNNQPKCTDNKVEKRSKDFEAFTKQTEEIIELILNKKNVDDLFK